jgi:hypothetical protein
MGSLSLCADSARPPGTTMLLENIDGSCITIGYKFCDKQQCYMAPNLYEVFNSDVTTYYSTQAAYSSSPLHLSTPSSLHVISALTCDIFSLAQRQTRTPLPICNWFEKQWLPATISHERQPQQHSHQVRWHKQPRSTYLLPNDCTSLALTTEADTTVLYSTGYHIHLTAEDDMELQRKDTHNTTTMAMTTATRMGPHL